MIMHIYYNVQTFFCGPLWTFMVCIDGTSAFALGMIERNPPFVGFPYSDNILGCDRHVSCGQVCPLRGPYVSLLEPKYPIIDGLTQ